MCKIGFKNHPKIELNENVQLSEKMKSKKGGVKSNFLYAYESDANNKVTKILAKGTFFSF